MDDPRDKWKGQQKDEVVGHSRINPHPVLKWVEKGRRDYIPTRIPPDNKVGVSNTQIFTTSSVKYWSRGSFG